MNTKDITTIITCHTNADWDALASMTALLSLYPNAALLFPGSMTPTIKQYYQEHILTQYPCLTVRDLAAHPIDTVVIADTAQFARVPLVHALLAQKDMEIHIWDHHPEYTLEDSPHFTIDNSALYAVETRLQNETNSQSTEIMLPSSILSDNQAPASTPIDIQYQIVSPHSHIECLGATATLVCEAMQERGIAPTAELATLLGLGLYTDTGYFIYPSTTARDMNTAAWLLTQGMNLKEIRFLLAEVQTPEHIHTLNALIENAKKHTLGQHTFIISATSSDIFIPNFSKIAQELMDIQPCDALFALATMEDKVMLVARSTHTDIDVSLICKTFGGGGHTSAASASIKNKMLEEIIDTIFQQIYAQVHPHKLAKDIMTGPPISLAADVSIEKAEQIMNRYGLKAAPVVRVNTKHCIGYIECQTTSRAIKHGLGAMPISEYMQRTIHTVKPDTPLQVLIDTIIGARQRLVPVIDNYEIVGVVTRTDLINIFTDDSNHHPAISPKKRKERQLGAILRTRLPKNTYDLLVTAGDLATKQNVKLYIVGGFVRDILLNTPPTHKEDIDMVVEGDGSKFAAALSTMLNGRVREHKAFMTSIIIYHDQEGHEKRIDIATARLEYYEYPAALPSVELSSIKMDLFRRDFTINAMAIHLNTQQFGMLVDFFGGQGDIEYKNLRVMHALSFVEDPTRILRAIRFEQRFDLRIISQTEKLIRNALKLHLLEKLSGSRILNELTLIFHEKNPKACCDRLQALGLLEAIHPALVLNERREQLLERLVDVLDWYAMLYQSEVPNYQILYLIALMSGLDDATAIAILQRLGVPENLHINILETRRNIYQCHGHLQAWHETKGTISQLWQTLHEVSLEGVLMLMARSKNEVVNKTLSHYITKWRLITIDINGRDLQKLGLEEGPLYGIILRDVLIAKLDQHITTREEQIQYAQKIIQERLQAL